MKIRAFAKINLTLDIIGKRKDGYHLLDMIMQTVDLHDDICITENKCGEITVKSSDNKLGGKDDIAYRAAEMFFSKAGIRSGADIFIDKSIPVSAGLGGGSTDAAAVVCGLNRIFSERLNDNQLEEICVRLGADVPFFIKGGTAFASGIGEILKPICKMPQCAIVIAANSAKRSTKHMYEIIDGISDLKRPDNKKVEAALKAGNLKEIAENLKNVFAAAWDDTDIRRIMEKYNSLCVSLSGSGPSFFGIFEREEQAKECAAELKREGIRAYLTHPTDKSFIILE